MIWGILSLSKLHMILKWRDSLPGKLLEGKSWGCAGQSFVNFSERSKDLCIQPHKGFLERLSMWPTDSPQLSHQKPKIEMKWSREDLWRTLLSNGVNSWAYMRDLQGSWEFYTRRNSGTWTERDREDEMKQDYMTPKILQARNRLIKLALKQLLSFKKKEKWLRRQICGPGELSLELQSIIPRPWNLLEFVQLNFEITWDWWFLYLFFFFFFLHTNVCNCYLMPVAPFYLGSRELVF